LHFIYLELLDKRVVDPAAHGSKNALLTEGTVQDLFDGNSAWDTNCDWLVNKIIARHE